MLNEVLLNLNDTIDVDVNTNRLVKLRKAKLGMTSIIRVLGKMTILRFSLTAYLRLTR